jgi:enolase
MSIIEVITAREIIDSRGNPTVEVDVYLEDGSFGRAAVPSGASTGVHEAVELRDGEKGRFMGKGVSKAVENVNTVIAQALEGMDALDQVAVDQALLELDGTETKGNWEPTPSWVYPWRWPKLLPATWKFPCTSTSDLSKPLPCLFLWPTSSTVDHTLTTLWISKSSWLCLWEPKASKKPSGSSLRSSTTSKSLLKAKGYSTAVGDEGGFAPNLKSNEEAPEIIIEAIKKAGYKPGEDVFIALDPASSEFYDKDKKKYIFKKSDGRELSSEEMASYWAEWVEKYPIISIEDGWTRMTGMAGNS